MRLPGFSGPAFLAGLSLALASCGGGSTPVALTIEGAPALTTSLAQIVLTGTTFIPAGSQCPKSGDFIVIGSFGEASIGTHNAATGADAPGFLQTPWVCNSGDDEVSWASNPITLAVGANEIRVTMSDARRSSTATVTVTRSGS